MSKRKRHRSRGRRNPLGLDSSVVKTAAWAVAGGVLARSGPEMLLPAQNTGIAGYGLNLATTIAASMLAGRFIGGEAAKGIMIGGVAGTGMRIVEEQFGKKLGEFSSLGLGGDPAYQLGDYGPAAFPLPFAGASPMAAAPAQLGNFRGF